MVTTDDRVKVLDFGLAKLLDPVDARPMAATRTGVTDAGMVVGTAAYMSPEQAEGKKVDARSDIFSFGAVLYEMMTGRRPFAGDSQLSILAKILNEEPTPPSTSSRDCRRTSSGRSCAACARIRRAAIRRWRT